MQLIAILKDWHKKSFIFSHGFRWHIFPNSSMMKKLSHCMTRSLKSLLKTVLFIYFLTFNSLKRPNEYCVFTAIMIEGPYIIKFQRFGLKNLFKRVKFLGLEPAGILFQKYVTWVKYLFNFFSEPDQYCCQQNMGIKRWKELFPKKKRHHGCFNPCVGACYQLGTTGNQVSSSSIWIMLDLTHCLTSNPSKFLFSKASGVLFLQKGEYS